jgi:hypothetical protein
MWPEIGFSALYKVFQGAQGHRWALTDSYSDRKRNTLLDYFLVEMQLVYMESITTVLSSLLSPLLAVFATDFVYYD